MSLVEWRSWLVLFAFSVLSALITVSIYTALGIALPLMVKDLAWNWTEAGLGFTVIGGCIGGSSYLPAYLIRKVGVRITLLIGTVLVAAGLLSLSLTHNLAAYFAGAALCGVGYQMMALIPATYVLGALFKRRSAAFGVYFTLSAGIAAVGPFMILGLLNLFHGVWRTMWLVEVFGALVIGSVCALIMGGRTWLARASERTETAIAEEQARPPTARTARIGVYRTREEWTLKAAVRTPQFYILLAAYFGHVLCLATTASFAVAHLTERHIPMVVVGTVLTLEGLVGMGWRFLAGFLGDIVNPRYLLMFAVGALVVGMVSLSLAHDYVTLIVFAVGVGIGTTVTALAVTVLALDYYGRKHNLEIFSSICMVGAVSALGPAFGGFLRDQFGGFDTTFLLFAGLNAVVFVATAVMRPPKRAGARAAIEPAPQPAAQFAKDAA